MPTHVTESTGASITAQWEFTTGSLIVSPTATIKADVVSETTSGTGVTVDGVLLKDGVVTFGAGVSLPVTSGGTGATTAANARTSLSAAVSGANSDITSLSGLTTQLTVAHGGTGVTTYSAGVMYAASTAGNVQTTGTGTSGYRLVANTAGLPVYDTPYEFISVAVTTPGTSLSATSDYARFFMPFAGYFNEAQCGVSTAPTGTTFQADVWINTSSIFSTKLTIDATETTSSTATTPAVISTATSAFNKWDVCRVHLDDTGSGTRGFVVSLICVRTN